MEHNVVSRAMAKKGNANPLPTPLTEKSNAVTPPCLVALPALPFSAPWVDQLVVGSAVNFYQSRVLQHYSLSDKSDLLNPI